MLTATAHSCKSEAELCVTHPLLYLSRGGRPNSGGKRPRHSEDVLKSLMFLLHSLPSHCLSSLRGGHVSCLRSLREKKSNGTSRGKHGKRQRCSEVYLQQLQSVLRPPVTPTFFFLSFSCRIVSLCVALPAFFFLHLVLLFRASVLGALPARQARWCPEGEALRERIVIIEREHGGRISYTISKLLLQV